MVRVTIRMVALTLALCAVGLPATAHAGGCEVLGDPRDRAECQARAVARETARDEVERQLESRSGTAASSDATSSTRSADWRAAMDEADDFDAGALLELRPLAAIGGLAWFALVLRARRRARARVR
jgi:hypothetical protein